MQKTSHKTIHFDPLETPLPNTYQAAKMVGWHDGYKRGSDEVLEAVTDLLDEIKPEFIEDELRKYIKKFKS